MLKIKICNVHAEITFVVGAVRMLFNSTPTFIKATNVYKAQTYFCTLKNS